jgi:hypothetical protein
MSVTIPPVIATAVPVVAIIGFIGLVLRLIGPWRKQIDDLEERMRKELRADKRRCEAELKAVKHRERATRQLIYSTLRLFDLTAAQRKPLLERIYDQLAAIEQAEAAESAIIATAGLGDQEE